MTTTYDHPLSYEEIKAMVDNGVVHTPNTQLRSPECAVAYFNYKQVLKQVYVSIEACILDTEFAKFPGQKTILTLNKFPYWIEEGLNHYVVWSLVQLPLSQAEEFAYNKLHTNDFVIWENKKQNKSIKGIQHFHVITPYGL
jgi:Protein of unknown function (DUF3605)